MIRIDIATAADVPEMHRVRMSVRENALVDPTRVQPRDYLPFLERDGRGWVAREDGEVVGFAVGDRARASVWALFVDPDRERRGIGRRLHDAMIEWLFAEGLERVELTTDHGTRAARVYTAAGWRYTGPSDAGEARFEMSRDAWLTRPGPGSPG